MSKPPINPEKTVAGIAVDPRTLERVIPESRRPDGTVRKQIKIRPGFTPQEDVRRFRGTKQAQMDTTALPKGHIIGWAPPPTATASSSTKPLSKSAKKNAKRKEKREAQKDDIPDNWEDEEGEGGAKDKSPPGNGSPTVKSPKDGSGDKPEPAPADAASELTDKLDKLKVSK